MKMASKNVREDVLASYSLSILKKKRALLYQGVRGDLVNHLKLKRLN